MTVKYYDWVEYQSNFRPKKIAIKEISNGRETSYYELNQRSKSLAGWLQNKGLKKGDRVAILTHNCAEVFELEFACGKIGGVELPLNWRLTKPELEYILNDSKPMCLIYSLEFKDIAQELIVDCGIKNSLMIEEDNYSSEYEQAILENNDFVTVESNHDDLIMLMYTSGTTGHPKGAMINHQMQFFNTVNLGATARITDKTIQLVVLPLFHTGGMNCYANPILHNGGQIVLMKEFDPGKALEIINNPDFGITHFFAVQIMDIHETGVGGLKSATFSIEGPKAYGVYKYEGGVHRVQRIPKTESGGRVHTSAATVAVLPEAETAEVEINDSEIKIDTYRASGAGGQHVNKTESAIRLTHIPTGLVVTCQDESSQHKNKASAMKVLRSRLFALEQEKLNKDRDEMRKSLVSTGDRSAKIRTYNFPQGRITDHRINYTTHKLQVTLEGELDHLIEQLKLAEDSAKIE